MSCISSSSKSCLSFNSNSTQDGLRRRMDKLKSSIEEGNRAVDKEREKNVSLLHLIFPPDIAKRLWLGRLIEPPCTAFYPVFSLFRGNYRGKNPRERHHAVQRHRRIYFYMFDSYSHDGDQHAREFVQSVRRILWAA